MTKDKKNMKNQFEMVDKNKVLLGFVDEPITDNYNDGIDYTTNKLGGLPDWVNCEQKRPIICKVCQSVTPLLLQIYAPVAEKIKYHRTLYIFACLNPSCWGNVKSWTCIKNQALMKETLQETFSTDFCTDDWCPDANNWDCGDSNQSDSSQNHFFSETEATLMMNRITVCEEENANVVSDSCVEIKDVLPSAEIEPDENEPITIDSPIIPHCDLYSLLQQHPSSSKTYREDTYFVPSFIYVMEEKLDKDPLSDRVQVLLMEYSKTSGNKNGLKVSNNVNVSQQSDEKYEKSNPLHGDKLFHSFLSRIKANPDQIIRYCRSDQAPLFLYPEMDIPSKCKHCNGEMIFEMQILPTVLNYLRLTNIRNEKDFLEFGSAFIYTCRDSCDKPDGEELIIVQLEKF